MNDKALDRTEVAADKVALSADDASRGSRPTWVKPELAEVDIASVTTAMGPGVADAGILS